MTFLVLIEPGMTVPAPHIACAVCGAPRCSRTAGTMNGTHRHHRPESRTWCYGPEVTERHARAKTARQNNDSQGRV